MNLFIRANTDEAEKCSEATFLPSALLVFAITYLLFTICGAGSEYLARLSLKAPSAFIVNFLVHGLCLFFFSAFRSLVPFD